MAFDFQFEFWNLTLWCFSTEIRLLILALIRMWDWKVFKKSILVFTLILIVHLPGQSISHFFNIWNRNRVMALPLRVSQVNTDS